MSVCVISTIGENLIHKDVSFFANKVFSKLEEDITNGTDFYNHQGWISEINGDKIKYYVNEGKHDKKNTTVTVYKKNYLARLKTYINEYKNDPDKFEKKYRKF